MAEEVKSDSDSDSDDSDSSDSDSSVVESGDMQNIVNAAAFKDVSDTVNLVIGDCRIRCSKYLLRQRSKYFEEMLSLSHSGDNIVLVESNPKKAVTFIILLHQLQPIEPAWDFDMAELAAKWSVEEYVRKFRTHCKNCISGMAKMKYKKKIPYSNIASPSRDLVGWRVWNFCPIDSKHTCGAFVVPYGGEEGVIEEVFTNDIARIIYKSMHALLDGLPNEIVVICHLPSGCIVHAPEQCGLDAKQFWEMVTLLSNKSSVYHSPGVLDSKADVVKLLKSRAQFIQPELMGSVFTEDEISILLLALK
jgi:hypothetical protein